MANDRDVEVWFRDTPFPFQSEFDAALRETRKYPVVRANFTRWDKKPSIGSSALEQRYLAGVWTISAYPVLRTKRADARRLLLAQGLPLLASWFTRDRPASWFYGRKVCELLFDPQEPKVVVEERADAV